jgi:hypothetical protein
MAVALTRNAMTAGAGNSAERNLCNTPRVKDLFAAYFKKPVETITQVAGRKKADVVVVFNDKTSVRIQNKDGVGNGRGWSADRRPIDRVPLDEDGKTLVANVCLKRGEYRPAVARPSTLIGELLLGTDPDATPEYFTHSVFHKETGELLSMSIGSADSVLSVLNDEAYDILVAKRTCVHISPRMYLQRKGGGSKDHAPNDIQLKLKSLPETAMTHLC